MNRARRFIVTGRVQGVGFRPFVYRLAASLKLTGWVQNSGGRVLIHADFSAGNLIAGPDGARCIDWQCPGMGDGAEDLWSFLSPAFQILYDREPWDAAAVARARDGYGDARTLARLDAMAPYFAFRFACYCVFLTHQLAGVDDAGSQRYRRAAAAEIALLEAAA